MDSIYFEDPLGLLIELASYRFEPPHGFTHADVLLEAHKIRVARGDYNIAADPPRRRDRGARQAIAPVAVRRPIAEAALQTRDSLLTHHRRITMAANTLSVLKPSVNNLLGADLRPRRRARVRRDRRLGQEGHARVPRQGPGRPDAAARGGGPPERLALGELRDHAVPLQQARARPALPDRPRPTGRWSTARCSTSSGRSIRSSPAPPIRRSASRSTRARSAAREADRGPQGAGAEGRRGGARGTARRLPHVLPATASGSSAAITLTIADIRLAATLEFLHAIDYDLPSWATDYMAAIESELGDAYSEPAADVRGFVASVKAPAT